MKLSSGYVPCPLAMSGRVFPWNFYLPPRFAPSRNRPFCGVRRDYAVMVAYLMPIDMIADKRGLVVNAGIKLGYRLPGMRKYLPAFRAAGAGGSAGPKP